MTNQPPPEPEPDERRDRYAAAIRTTDGWVLDDYRHMIDAVMAVADAELTALRAQHTAPAPSAADLRDRVRRVLCERDGKGALWGTDMLEPDEYGGVADAVLAVLPAPALAAARQLLGTTTDDTAADEAQPATHSVLADCATEYRVPIPENGGTELRLRKGTAPHASGWSVAVPGYGGGMALTELGWADAIGALSAARLFCWPDPATAVEEARHALGRPRDEAQPASSGPAGSGRDTDTPETDAPSTVQHTTDKEI